MSKASLCIQMLEILYSRNVIGISELARLLDTNPRNIPEYKKELELSGYVIETIPGRYGGYALNKKYTFPSAKLNESERDGLMQGYDYLLSRNDFMRKDDYSRAMAKISSALMTKDAPDDVLLFNRFPLAMPQRELEARYLAMSHCIAGKTVIRIVYLSKKNKSTERHFHPYRLFMYNNAWFVLGFDEKSQKVLYFKLNRILSYSITDSKFRIPLTYNERDYLDEYGMKQNGEWIPISLKLSGRFAMLAAERIYGKSQTVEYLDSSTAVLSCEMQNREDIISFVLGFGTDCEVLSPEWLKNELSSIAKSILKKYGEEAAK